MSLDPGRGIPADLREWYEWCNNQATWNRIVKSSEEIRDSGSTGSTLTNDDSLLFTVKAYDIIVARYVFIYNTTTNAGFKCGINGPSSPTKLRYRIAYTGPGATSVNAASVTSFGASTNIGTVSNGMGTVHIDLICSNGANDGTIALQWAQATSHADDTTVHEGAYVEYLKL